MAGLLDIAQERLMGLLNVPTEMQRFATNPQAFLSLLGINKLPKETGFAAGATGLPAKDVVPSGVLNPPNLAYQQGYEQGEPFSYAAMAAPMAIPVGKALAPKAYDMLENYMVQTGGLLPLTAYHGTPHNIQGKFDISKVGTGEGAQAYGHGMYFAENPAVAGEYKRKLSGGLGSPSNELMLNGQPLTDLTEAQRRAYEIVARDGRKNALGTAKDLEAQGFDASYIREALNATKGKEIGLVKNEGNLYKVDIPDEQIPNMLDWDKPINKQSKLVQNVANELLPKIKQVSPNVDINKMTGQDFYRAYQRYRGNYPDFASEGLNEAGIKGIRYLDEGSRVDFKYSGDPAYIYAGNSFKESGYTAQEALSGMKQAYKNADPKELELAINDIYQIQPKKTSNFVVFEPSTVNILEKNNIPLEGLLD